MPWFRRRDGRRGSADSAPPPGGSHVINVTTTGITIDDTLHETLSVAALTALLGEPRVVPPEDPTPDDRRFQRSTMVIWDRSGVRVFTKGDDEATELAIRLADDPDWRRSMSPELLALHPTSVFVGGFTIGGADPRVAVSGSDPRMVGCSVHAEVGSWRSDLLLNQTECGEVLGVTPAGRSVTSSTDDVARVVREATHPFREVMIGYRAPKPVEQSSGRWTVPAATEPVLEIASFPFRLAIIQELMFEQDRLTPRFDVHDFAADHGAPSFDPDEIGYEIIPEVRNWFHELPIPARLATDVETLVLDGGNDVYLQLIPQWDGEDDSFVIESLTADDLAPFTRLRVVDDIGGFLGPRARAVLIDHGITVS
jgi:hypothetical protein